MGATLDEILQAHRAGDERAAERLVEYCRARVYRRADQLLPDFARVARHERPSDVAQDALVGLWQALRTMRPESERHLLLLAGKKVRETLYDLARRHAGQRHGLGKLESQGDVPADQHAALAAVDNVTGPATLDDWTRFQCAIDMLPEDEREVMHLKWFVGMGEDEIAEVVGLSRSTVQRLWKAAKHGINQAMGREQPQ
jgi:RNA polymerase sigma factor (sigma-70 family)